MARHPCPSIALEEASRQFLHACIELNFTFAHLADTAYALGHRVHGNQLAVKTKKAAAEIAHRLMVAESRGWYVTDLQRRYRALEAAIAVLHPPA